MKKVDLAYGKNGLEIEVPEYAVILEPTHFDGLKNDKEAVQKAMREPINSKPLKDMVKADDTVAIVISDMTRPTPNHKLVPWIIEELSHVKAENFLIINGVGSHRANTRDELITMLSQDIVDNYKILNHDSFDDNELVHVGTNTYGSDVYINKSYLECSFKIVTGFIEPHFFAGFSGGPKGINPGISGIKTIVDFHNAQMIGDKNSTWGLIEGNILQDAATQNCLMAKPDFMLNVTLNSKKEITNVFAGEIIAAHRAGCAFVKEHAMTGVDDAFDIVITTNSGYPLDQNLYQSVKGFSAAAEIIKEGGTIISACECSDGVPNHGNYAKILKMKKTPEELLEMINDSSFSMFDQWQVQKQALIQTKANCYIYSLLDDETVEDAMFKPCHDINAKLKELIDNSEEEPRIAVLPLGPLTIPYVK